MYTVDDDQKDLYEEEEYENSKWDNYKGLIFKIIIIILCIIVLIWLVKALKSNRTLTDDGEIHAANTEKIRLAAEDYFFLKDNKNKTSYVTLAGLKNAGLIDDVVDANNKTCSDTDTNVNLLNEVDSYKMTIKFACSTNNKDEVFYYNKGNLACLNCTGKTHMDGKTVVIDDKPEEKETNPNYSCISWSNWTKDRVYDETLTEKVKVLVQGVKYGNKTEYGNWSEYTTIPIVQTDGIEVETKVNVEDVWSEPMTSTSINTGDRRIRVISTNTVDEGGSGTCNGTLENDVCYGETKKGNLTYKEYISGNYKIKKAYCEGTQMIKGSSGSYELTYIDCEYSTKVSDYKKGSSYTVYTYQVLENKEVTYYRYRTVTNVEEPTKYTDTKYEEKNLPSGYVKVPGTEETYYSYKISSCEK